MSAFTVGTQSAKKDDAGTKEARTDPASTAGKAFIKWIPGDAIVLYTAILAIGVSQVQLTDASSALEKLRWVDVHGSNWFIFALVSAALLVIVGAYAKDENPKKVALIPLVTRIVLTLAAFTIWTTLLPGSWTYQWDLVQDMGDAYVLVLGIVAVVFTWLAEWLTQVSDVGRAEPGKGKTRAVVKAQRDKERSTSHTGQPPAKPSLGGTAVAPLDAPGSPGTSFDELLPKNQDPAHDNQHAPVGKSG